MFVETGFYIPISHYFQANTLDLIFPYSKTLEKSVSVSDHGKFLEKKYMIHFIRFLKNCKSYC